ncbi:uncharacterized protein [Rutidosis leptorrhynchoides]|uniref:uncharacterized protein n=1 Tax=Rutidosis leptorrhynchoides TaxID=125765 RepID=UPI003A99907F
MDPQVFQNPLFLHPSDGPGSLPIQEKLIGAQNYRSWRRSVEIELSTKHKLGFVTGTIARPADDLLKQINGTCSIIRTASEIWKQLEKRFALSNGSRKYKLHKEIYSCEQQGVAVSEFYTKMKCIWEEIDSMSDLPRVTGTTPKIVNFLNVVNRQKEEQHLFQFLNGLDEHFSSLRSQLLMMNPLPSVEIACSMIQQEESQREMFSSVDSTALYSRTSTKDKCEFCGFKWHSPDKCWEKIGYPPWHYKSRLAAKQTSHKAKHGGLSQAKKTAASVKGNNVIFISEQCSDDELDHHFAAGILSKSSNVINWILDTGATNHMTPSYNELIKSKLLLLKPHIRLPNGNTYVITHIGKFKLGNEMEIKDVLVVPSFKFSLLSVPKLTKDKSCVVIFYSQFCLIQDLITRKVIGLGERKEDLYHLVNVPLHQVNERLVALISDSVKRSCLFSIKGGYSANNSKLVMTYSL